MSPPLSELAQRARDQALLELEAEDFAERVAEAKVAIRQRRARAKWWHTLIPFNIKIERRQPVV